MYFGANYLGGYVSHKQKLSSFVENPYVFGGVLSLICWQELGYDVQNDPTHLDDQVVRDDTKSLNTSGDDIPQVLLWQQNPHYHETTLIISGENPWGSSSNWTK